MPAKIKYARSELAGIISVEQAEFPEQPYGKFSCHLCSAPLSFVRGYPRHAAHFRLAKFHVHAQGCTYRSFARELKAIAQEAPPGLMAKTGNEFRLLVAQEELQKFDTDSSNAARTQAWDREARQERARSRLAPSINCAMKVLKLRALLIEGSAMERRLKLQYGKQPVAWQDFYFERGGYERCFAHLIDGGLRLPMAIEGIVRYAGPHIRKTDRREVGLLSLQPHRSAAATDRGIQDVFAPEIWASNPHAFRPYLKGQLVLAFGLWSARPVGPLSNGAYRNHVMRMSLYLPTQVCLAMPSRPG